MECKPVLEKTESGDFLYCETHKVYFRPDSSACDACAKKKFPPNVAYVTFIEELKTDLKYDLMSQKQQEEFLNRYRKILLRKVEMCIISQKDAIQILEEHL